MWWNTLLYGRKWRTKDFKTEWFGFDEFDAVKAKKKGGYEIDGKNYEIAQTNHIKAGLTWISTENIG